MPLQSKNVKLNILNREINVTLWGKSNQQAVLLLHGFTRHGRDFDSLASHLQNDYLVVCPDLIGRGLSQWSPAPALEYNFDFYQKLLINLAEQLDLPPTNVLGSSMGGLLGILLAIKQPLKQQVKRLIVNDIGPEITSDALYNIVKLTSDAPSFENFSQLESYFKEYYSAYGLDSARQWRDFTKYYYRRKDDGQFTVNYDPKIATPFFQSVTAFDGWELFKQIPVQTLIIRAQNSDLFSASSYQKMQKIRPEFEYVEFKNVGHIPMFNREEQIIAVKNFLKSPA